MNARISHRPNPRLVTLTALLAATAACSDQQPMGLDLDDRGASFSMIRSTPTDLSGINTHYGSHEELLYATANNGFGSSSLFTALSDHGGHLQVGLRSTVEAGFPSNGSNYLIVTSGDSRDIRSASGYYPGSCGAVETGLCDVGGASMPVAIPVDATTLEFDLRYYSHDDTFWPDPFRVHLTAGGTTSLVKELTTTQEFAGLFKSAGAFAWSPKMHHVVVDVAAYAGQTVELKFLASDTDDGFGGAFDSGAAIDNIRVVRDEIQAPVITDLIATPNPVAINTPLAISAFVDDQATGGSTIQAAQYSLDGGTTWHTLAAADGQFNTDREQVTATLAPFTAATVVTLLVRGQDSNNITSATQALEIAVYDPNGSYIAGSGSIDSPLGAYSADPTLAGSASFGFSSKYARGTNVPDGNTRFTFRTADFKFESTSYDWLVVAGAKGQFKGSGTINGAGDYGFKLTGVDGKAAGDGIDKFRIKIWDKATGAVVYDNELGTDENGDPTTGIRNGQIMIKR